MTTNAGGRARRWTRHKHDWNEPQARRLHRTWTEPAGSLETFPVIEPDERDGMTLEEIEEMAERDRDQQQLEDEPA